MTTDPKRFASIPTPLNDVMSLAKTAAALKDGYSVMAGHSGSHRHQLVSLQDLIDLGLTTEAEITEKLGVRLRA